MPGGWLLNVTAKPILPLLEDGFSIWIVTRKQNMPTGHTVEAMAADCAELTRSQFDGRVDVILGVSYGGIIAQYVAANHADCFDHIVVALAACEVRNADRDYEWRGSRANACVPKAARSWSTACTRSCVPRRWPGSGA